MNNNILKGQLKNLLSDFLIQRGVKNTSANFSCILGTHEDKTPSMHYYEETKTVKCFSCDFHGDIFDVVGHLHNINGNDFYQKLKKTAEVMGISTNLPNSIEYNKKKYGTETKKSNIPASEKDLISYIEKSHLHITETDYLKKRGLSDNIVKKYKLGYDSHYVYTSFNVKKNQTTNWEVGKSIIFPYPNDDYYLIRPIDGSYTGNAKYLKLKGIKQPIFNLEVLLNSEKPVFICEGLMDALSFEEVGAEAIATAGTGFTNLVEICKAKKHKCIPVIAMDNDEAGRKAAFSLEEEFKRNKIFYFRADNIAGEYKDASEALEKDRLMFEKRVKEAVKIAMSERNRAKKPDSVSEYLKNIFMTEIDAYKPYKDTKTGFGNIDREMSGIKPGLYVIGGISSVGKTTFVHQLCDQFAERHEHILYFSLEQSRLEMVSKSLSRITAQLGESVTAVDIRMGESGEAVQRAKDKYMEIAYRVSIIQGDFSTTVGSIDAYIDTYISENGVKPIIAVDYLQIIQGDDRHGGNTKERIDVNVTELKRISRKHNVILFVISSLNRGNYLTSIDFESFKESGGIEYTADVIWGLQLQAVNSDVFNGESGIKSKREQIIKAKNENPRKIELVCLKNRNGKANFTVGFMYNAKYDLFEEDNNYKSNMAGISSKEEKRR